MSKSKKILVSIFMIVILIFSTGCNNSNGLKNQNQTDFPKDDKGYPERNIVIVNGEEYNLDNIEKTAVDSPVQHEIDLELSEEDGNIVEIILPQINPINIWSIENKENVDLVLYSKDELIIEENNMLEGVSANLQKFRFTVPQDEDTYVSFKWANVNEIKKSFDDKKERYLLTIKISDKQ